MAKFNIKQFVVEKSERVLVGVAGAIAFFLILTQLFMPGHGFFAPNPKDFKVKLENVTTQVANQLRSESNVPGPSDLPDAKKADPKSLEGFAVVKLNDSSKYRVQEMFAVSTPADSSRRTPEVKALVEGRAVFSHTQIRSYILNNNKTEIMVLDGAGAGPAMAGGISNEQKKLGSLLGKGGKGPGGPGPGGPGPGNFGPGKGQGNFQPPETGGLSDEAGPPSRWLPIDKLATQTNVRLAETVRPVRTIVVAASFPYRAQLDEFRTKLRLPSRAAVLAEPSLEVDPSLNQQLPAFRFLGIKAQRMEVDAAGKPVQTLDPTGRPRDPWMDVDLRQDYKEYLVLNGKRFEPEDPGLEYISFDRLVMPRLLNMRPNQYPPVEKTLPTLVASLAALKDKAPVGAPPSLFNVDDFDPFSRGPMGGPNQPGMVGGEGMPIGPRPGQPPFGTPPFGMPPIGPGGRPGQGAMPGVGPGGMLPEVQPPEHCLVRIVDVKVEPGKSYKYRLQVEMANPNYLRTDVANPKYGESKVLPPSAWYEIPNAVVVPSDLHYYAVDQKEVEGKDYKGINADAKLTPNQTVLQIHRWLEKLELSGRRPAYVGEWIVGERLVVGRGEYVGRDQVIEVPVWMERREAFVIPKKKDGQKEITGSPVSFGTLPYDSVVVDFNAGETRYEITEMKADKPMKTAIRDNQRNEVLLCTPDGRLLALDGGTEGRDDPDRVRRLEEYRARIKEVKSQKGPGTTGPGTTGPFSGP